MKQKYLLLFFTLPMVMPLVANAQSFVVEVPYSAPVQNGIARELPNSDIVSYVETSTDHWITFATTANNAVENFQIPSDLFIKDLYVFGELVYFCGHDKNSGQGVWGYLRQPIRLP